ncbi:biotin-dependent carboxyltransferase family protein [Peribacillus alkalitolerans]|uniref:5-oxoprolinase subunit C family protein n=1 Tax=Peribacillus alkalitolerans TaxID=1550385 RepID=UPI0013D84717|nr:biotin-dependent carboxyltransferase family protein [Peribacillus alkalitolerans]
MSLLVIRPGLLSSVQDNGRYGYQKYGVIASGVMDPLAHRIANMVVGNEGNEATIEITMVGPVIEFQNDTLFSLCGGDLSPTINNVPVPLWRPVWVRKGAQLKFGTCLSGCRAYLAVAGGFDIPVVMGSKSTYLRGGIGGCQGRALKAGDRLEYGNDNPISQSLIQSLSKEWDGGAFAAASWSVSPDILPNFQANPVIRVIRGKEYHWFTEESQNQLFKEGFSVSPQSDRMGYRLKGPYLSLKEPMELISEAVSFGTVQVPAEGQPIVLLADRQTTGGYPKIAQIISVDLPLMGQLKPGDRIHFYEVSHREAEEMFLLRETKLKQLKSSILLKG